MFVRSLEDIIGSERDVDWGNGQSRRFVLARDKLGFALCDTQVLAGSVSHQEYKNHLEACYCIEGTGEIEDAEGNIHQLRPGVLYALDKHDRHILRATTDMRLISVFNPPIEGHESHSYGGEASSY
jgi:L-ectoine synthase